VNKTDERITVLVDGSVEATVEPLGTEKVGSLELLHPATFEARDESGASIYKVTLTWEELRQRNWQIVIEPTEQAGLTND